MCVRSEDGEGLLEDTVREKQEGFYPALNSR